MDDPTNKLKAKRYEELKQADPARSQADIVAQIEREFKVLSAPVVAESASVARPAPAEPPPTARPAAPRPVLSGGEKTAGAMRSLLQGLTFQNWDEIEAGINAAIDPDLTYRNYRDAIREQEGEFRQASPKTAFALEMGGAVLPAGLALLGTGGAAAPAVSARATPLLGRMVQGAGTGLGFGAAQGVGAASEMADIPKSVAVSGGVGSVLGGALPVAGSLVSGLMGGVGNMAESAVRSTATGQGATAALARQLLPMADRRAANTAVTNILRRLEEDGLTPQQAVERLKEMTSRGTPAAVADVGGRNMLELANRPNTLGGRGREVMGELGESRVAGSAERLATATEKNAGTLRGNVNQMVRDIADRRRAPATQLYNEAFAHGEVKLNPRQYQIMTSDVATDAQRAWKQGQRLSVLFAGEPNLPPLAPLFEVVDDVYAGKAISLLRQPTVRDLNYIKLGLDDAIAAAERAGDNTAMAALTKAKNDLIDPVKAQVPKYAEALDFWGGEQGLMNALNAGKRFLRGSADDFDDVVSGLSPDELEMFRTGAVNAIREQLQRRDGSVNAARFMSDPTVLQRLQRVFPDDVMFERLKNVIGDETRLAALDKRLRNQSATARNLAEWADEAFSGSFSSGNPLTDATFRTVGGMRDFATRQARSASTDALADLLSLQGNRGITFLESLDDISRGVMARNAARSSAAGRTAGYAGGLAARGMNR